jgi:hypothetical protein
MKFRIIEHINSEGVPYNYEIQQRFMFLWLPCFCSYSRLEDAQRILSKLNGTKRVVS